MFGQTFYFNTIRKYVILFGTLFNDIHIVRKDSTGKITSVSKVPLTYAPKEKVLARVENDPNIDRQFAVSLPMMSFEMKKMSYDGTRKLPTINKVSRANTSNKDALAYQYNPVPYNIQFELNIMVKNAEDGTKIVEQILPFFTPDWTTTVKMIPEMNIIADIPVILNNIQLNDAYDGDFKTRRSLIWTLDFTLRGYIYGPVKQSAIIKFANTDFFIASTDNLSSIVGQINPAAGTQLITPGLTANGQPTSNASLSVPPNEILATDNFGYIVSANGG
jgi:hypothetical protein